MVSHHYQMLIISTQSRNDGYSNGTRVKANGQQRSTKDTFNWSLHIRRNRRITCARVHTLALQLKPRTVAIFLYVSDDRWPTRSPLIIAPQTSARTSLTHTGSIHYCTAAITTHSANHNHESAWVVYLTSAVEPPRGLTYVEMV